MGLGTILAERKCTKMGQHQKSAFLDLRTILRRGEHQNGAVRKWPKMTSVIFITWPKMTSIIFITSISL